MADEAWVAVSAPACSPIVILAKACAHRNVITGTKCLSACPFSMSADEKVTLAQDGFKTDFKMTFVRLKSLTKVSYKGRGTKRGGEESTASSAEVPC